MCTVVQFSVSLMGFFRVVVIIQVDTKSRCLFLSQGSVFLQSYSPCIFFIQIKYQMRLLVYIAYQYICRRINMEAYLFIFEDCFMCMQTSVQHACSIRDGQKKTVAPLELELHPAVSCHVSFDIKGGFSIGVASALNN